MASVSSEVISEKAKAEGGPHKGSESAQLQSQATKELNAQKARDEVTAKMEKDELLTKEDTAYIQSREQKELSGQRPPKGSVSAQAQSQAAKSDVSLSICPAPPGRVSINNFRIVRLPPPSRMLQMIRSLNSLLTSITPLMPIQHG